MKIRNKFFLFATVISTLTTIGSLTLGFTNLRSVEDLFKSRQQEKENLFDQLHKLKSSTLLSYAYDYSYWDEMVKLAEKGNLDFAKQNIDPSLATYKANAAWVYDLDFKLAYSVNNLSDNKLKEPPLAINDLSQAFGNNPFPHFYIKTGSDIIEVAGAPIQPTADVERKTTPHGYFLVERVWDEAYFKEFSDLLGGVVEKDHVDQNENPSFTDKPKGTISFHRSLAGFDGKIAAGFHIKVNLPLLGNIYRTTQLQLYYLFFVSFAAVAISMGILYLIAIRPINLISKSLDDSDIKWLRKIQNSKDEFGQVAKLIIKFFEQKAVLEKEVAEHFRAGKEMEKQKNDLERINSTMIDRELKMIDLKKELSDLRKVKEKENVSKEASATKDSSINRFEDTSKSVGLSKTESNKTVSQGSVKAFREGEMRFDLLFENMVEGLAYCEMVFENEQPVDFIYKYVNSTFEKLTGLKNVVGKKVTEIIPGIKKSNPELFEIYARVSLTGNPERFESHSDDFGGWLAVSTYSPGKGCFIAVFENITERKKIEAEKDKSLAELEKTNQLLLGRESKMIELKKKIAELESKGKKRDES